MKMLSGVSIAPLGREAELGIAAAAFLLVALASWSLYRWMEKLARSTSRIMH